MRNVGCSWFDSPDNSQSYPPVNNRPPEPELNGIRIWCSWNHYRIHSSAPAISRWPSYIVAISWSLWKRLLIMTEMKWTNAYVLSLSLSLCVGERQREWIRLSKRTLDVRLRRLNDVSLPVVFVLFSRQPTLSGVVRRHIAGTPQTQATRETKRKDITIWRRWKVEQQSQCHTNTVCCM